MKRIILAGIGGLFFLLGGMLFSQETPRSPFTPLIKPQPTPVPVPAELPVPASSSLASFTNPGANGLPDGCLLFPHCRDVEPVLFNHKKHQKRTACASCHEGDAPLFARARAGTPLLMTEMYEGKTCGACHDGKTAFTAIGNCQVCHNHYVSP